MGIEQIQKIHEFGEINVIIIVLLVAALIIALRAGWEKLLDALGLETKASLRQKTMDEKIARLEDKLKDFEQSQHDYHAQSITIRDDLKANQENLQSGINELKSLLIDKEIDDMRWEMLDFANAVMNKRKYNKEQYDHVLDTYAKYERILEENGMENGRVTSSMEFIQDQYKRLMAVGFKHDLLDK